MDAIKTTPQNWDILSTEANIKKQRAYLVVKSNDLIKKSRFQMSLAMQRIVLYMISRIPEDAAEFDEIELDTREFCKICDIDYTSGKAYASVKKIIKDLCDRSVWVELPTGEETLLRWIEKPYIRRDSGRIRVRLDRDMVPYLLNLKSNFTKYELFYALRFRSKYAIRLYEYIKCIHYHEDETYTKCVDISELRRVMGADTVFPQWINLRDRALAPAIDEINALSDKNVAFKPIRSGRAGIVAIELTISTKPMLQQLAQHEEGIRQTSEGGDGDD